MHIYEGLVTTGLIPDFLYLYFLALPPYLLIIYTHITVMDNWGRIGDSEL